MRTAAGMRVLSLDVVAAEREKCEAPVGYCTHCDLGAKSFCSGLSTEQFRRFMTFLGQTSIEPNTTIFREGDTAQHLYEITVGAVKLYKLLSDGRRQIIAFLFPGDFFGLSYNGTYAYTAEAMLPVMVCRFPKRQLDSLFQEIPSLEKKLLGATAQELAAAHDQMLLLGRKTAREKVASFLVMLWDRLCGDSRERHQVINLPMSRSDIADFLGLTIETVSRTLTGFRREGLIALPDINHLLIKQHEALQHIAEGA